MCARFAAFMDTWEDFAMTADPSTSQEGNRALLLLLVLQVLLSTVIVWRVIRVERILLNNRDKQEISFEHLPVVDGVSVSDSPLRGPDSAPVTIVEFADYECPACRAAYPLIEEVLEENLGTIRFAHRDFPLPSHPNAMLAAEAARCAERQGEFWAMHAAIFSSTDVASLENLQAMASGIGLDRDRFDRCLADDEVIAAIQADIADGRTYGIEGTPTYFINGRMIEGVLSVAQWQELIDAAIREGGPR